jgi:hypothetical protein
MTERYLTDFGDIPNDETTDMAPMIQAAINSLDTNRAGTIVFPDQGKLYIASGLTAVKQGTALVSDALPGTSDDLARGSLQIIVGPGIWGLTVGSPTAAHFRGYRVAGIHFFEKTAGTALGGIKIINASNGSYERVACGRFTNGTGIFNAGGGGNQQSQYNTFTDCRVGKCAIGYRQTGANGTVWMGGLADGATNGPNLTAGSIGFKIESGDTFRAFGTRVQGYDTLYELGPNLGHELHGVRCEIWGTQAVHVLANSRGAYLTGFGDNSLRGGGGMGVVIDSGASDTANGMDMRDCSGGPMVDRGTRTRLLRAHGTPASATATGKVVGKAPFYNADGSAAGFAALYDTIN